MKSFDSKAIIFDLDGTLIDSAEGIRQSIKNSFNNLNIEDNHFAQTQAVFTSGYHLFSFMYLKYNK